jgi:hypothetical protein
VLRRFQGLPYGLVDLLPSRAPVLIGTDVPEGRLVDVVGDAGCRAAGLPASYPLDGRGRTLPWERTQPVGEAVWEQGERGIACRSSAMTGRERGEELAWFVRGSADRLRINRRRAFEDWF